MREIFAILVGWLSLQCLAGEKDVGGKVSDIRKGLTVEEKIDLLCADAPAVVAFRHYPLRLVERVSQRCGEGG